jgi:hypothetical protein
MDEVILARHGESELILAGTVLILAGTVNGDPATVGPLTAAGAA